MRATVQTRRRIVVGVAAVLVLALIWGLSSWWTSAHRSLLVRGLEDVPGDAQRISFTDWNRVGDAVGTKGGTSGILDRAYDADLSSTSALVTSATALDKLGLPLTELAWEMYAQADDGAVELLSFDSGEDRDRWLSRLRKAGWANSSAGTTSHPLYDGTDPVSDLGLSPELTYVTATDDLLIASDNPDYALQVAGRDMASPSSSMTKAAAALGRHPLSAVVFSGDYTCGHLAMSQADDLDQQQATVLLKAAGETDPMSAFAMAYVADVRHLRVAMEFDNDDVAAANADSRATLAAGDAPGQGGTFSERYRLGEVKSDGTTVTMAMTPKKGQSVLSDLSSGPVLWASC